MKKMSLIFVIVTVSCVMVMGGTGRKLAVVKRGETFKVIYDDPSTCKVKVSILNEEGQEVFTEKVTSHGGFVRPYNFSQLPKGSYTLEVTDPSGDYREKIAWEDPQWITHVSKVNCPEKKYIVMIPQHQGSEEVTIHVYDQNHELVFSERKKPEDEFGRVYHLKNLEGATIRLVNHNSGEEKVFATE